MKKVAVHTDHAPAAIGPYSQAVRAGSLVFCSGQIALQNEVEKQAAESGSASDSAVDGASVDAVTGLVQGGVAAETRQVLANLGQVLRAAGAQWDDVVKTTIYLTNLGDFKVVNDIYAEHFSSCPPARATVQVAALPRGATVEIDAIACVDAANRP
jgi:2-iminobutanoate/2-iminopropanoate deaminase